MDSAPRRPKILAFEDDRDLAEIIKSGLSARYEVLCSGQGSRALEDISLHEPALILLDVHLPHVNGLEICGWVRSHPRLGRIPVLFLTGQTDAWTREKARQAGASGYLTKPVDILALRKAIEDLIG